MQYIRVDLTSQANSGIIKVQTFKEESFILTTLIDQIAQRDSALTVPELAKILNISSRSVYEHVQAGRLPSMRIGTSVRLDPSQTASWLSKRAA